MTLHVYFPANSGVTFLIMSLWSFSSSSWLNSVFFSVISMSFRYLHKENYTYCMYSTAIIYNALQCVSHTFKKKYTMYGGKNHKYELRWDVSSTSKQISNKLWKWKTSSCWGVMEGAYNIGNNILASIWRGVAWASERSNYSSNEWLIIIPCSNDWWLSGIYGMYYIQVSIANV